jgi:hypothetical protein
MVSDGFMVESAFQKSRNCPLLPDLLSGVDSNDAAALAHLERCAHCRNELQSYQSFMQSELGSEERASVDWIASRLRNPNRARRSLIRRWFAWIFQSTDRDLK